MRSFNANWAAGLRRLRKHQLHATPSFHKELRPCPGHGRLLLLFLSPRSAAQNLLSTPTNPLVYHLLQIYTKVGDGNLGDRDKVSGPHVQSPLRFCKDLLARTTTLPWHVLWLHRVNVPPLIYFVFYSLTVVAKAKIITALCLFLCLVPGPSETRILFSFPTAGLCSPERGTPRNRDWFLLPSLLFYFLFTFEAWYRWQSLRIIPGSLGSTENKVRGPVFPILASWSQSIPQRAVERCS